MIAENSQKVAGLVWCRSTSNAQNAAFSVQGSESLRCLCPEVSIQNFAVKLRVHSFTGSARRKRVPAPKQDLRK